MRHTKTVAAPALLAALLASACGDGGAGELSGTGDCPLGEGAQMMQAENDWREGQDVEVATACAAPVPEVLTLHLVEDSSVETQRGDPADPGACTVRAVYVAPLDYEQTAISTYRSSGTTQASSGFSVGDYLIKDRLTAQEGLGDIAALGTPCSETDFRISLRCRTSYDFDAEYVSCGPVDVVGGERFRSVEIIDAAE